MVSYIDIYKPLRGQLPALYLTLILIRTLSDSDSDKNVHEKSMEDCIGCLKEMESKLQTVRSSMEARWNEQSAQERERKAAETKVKSLETQLHTINADKEYLRLKCQQSQVEVERLKADVGDLTTELQQA